MCSLMRALISIFISLRLPLGSDVFSGTRRACSAPASRDWPPPTHVATVAAALSFFNPRGPQNARKKNGYWRWAAVLPSFNECVGLPASSPLAISIIQRVRFSRGTLDPSAVAKYASKSLVFCARRVIPPRSADGYRWRVDESLHAVLIIAYSHTATISRTLHGGSMRMVELCELKLMEGEMEWPADMDEHVANLDFERSMDADESNSLFSSMALDKSFKSQLLISTDSLDMERLHERCLTNKNDYKLTFAAGEESGHWATSSQLVGDVVPSPSPTGGAAVFNRIDPGLTTWGRIRSAEPPPDDRTSSLPDLGRRPATVGDRRRPTSLLATFVERQPDYEYSELYMGNGRYVDVNDNEIGFVPESTAPVQRPAAVIDRWQAAISPLAAPPRPRRTFADLQGGQQHHGSSFSSADPRSPTTPSSHGVPVGPSSSSSTHAPSSTFWPCHTSINIAIHLPDRAVGHPRRIDCGLGIPSFCGRSSLSLSQMMERVRQDGASSTRLCLDAISDSEKMDASVLSALDKRDSGLGCSGGPVHIEDWPSLAVLLPKNVVDACSFFKSNSRLLTGSSTSATTNEASPSSGISSPSNNIEAKRRPSSATRRPSTTTEACRTCFSVRKRLQPPTWAQPANLRRQLCDCTTSEVIERSWTSGTHATTSVRERDAVARLKLHATELSIVGLPIYAAKRVMVERVVEGVADIARGGNSARLCEAMEAIVTDGLFQELHPWNMITAVTASGPATANIYAIVKELDAGEKPLNSRVQTFFKRLLSAQGNFPKTV
ncbi:hypothetical protein L596_007786 [Steinernema carpocapsae]|uniref:Uncharacterized protein n=1 Tax=Steinernema carpocapsae TaxID=34508 RepID=A0A4U5PB03_STECR|nr:hypothetical protein L596_007786 [Steinernema carpocapsae]